MIEFEDFLKLDIVIGKIEQIDEIKNSKKLLKLFVDFKDEKRIILAGIKNNFKKEELLGKKALFLKNIKPRKILNQDSHGMLLVAQDDLGNLSLLNADEKMPIGSKIC